ncbi:hydroxyethylthiazole kinase-like uncharacterized protein yjeF [Novosphingobium sp. PhB57]|jgi:hydroxyethylthiazole kinase-like uncharacterized protein yjeF|uniref:NAD(P)H-hydrate dehydratase n=1 Tax=Novosphingobium sp. PhB57 TaxID=2485107 RepID=UPI0010F1DE29|nr:NAD(P)H-hydrate dehydratase [Novosphingobium sp. PhB57]TCU51434.1 hydroxyethylthiazole kinase-like uncharacterized protein yjeF [Novosphingobium sp. PhB57]
MMETIDERWLVRNPLPTLYGTEDKNARGRVLVVGGAEFVPGAIRLTGEAVLRAGAGKLQLATVSSAATALGVLVPEAAMIALPADQDGEIALEAAALLSERIRRCDTLVVGPGMSVGPRTDQLVASLLAEPDNSRTVVLDAAALTSARDLPDLIAGHEGRVVLTPHHGEMAHLAGITAEEVALAPETIALKTARRFGCIILLKSRSTLLAAPSGELLRYESGCVGLATGGSGDVLAGIVGGLCARGASPLTAAAWACWVHGKAGRTLSQHVGRAGFLARELLPLLPKLLDGTAPE